MAKAKKTKSKKVNKKIILTFWDRVARGVKKLLSPAFPKRGR